MYTHSLVARTFFCAQRARCVLRTLFMRVTYMHGSRSCKKGVCRMSCSQSRFLSSHVSPVSAVLVHPLRHPLSVRNLPVLSRLESAGHAQLRTCIEEFGYLAKSAANTEDPPRETRRHFLLTIGFNQQNSEVGKLASKAKSLILRSIPE